MGNGSRALASVVNLVDVSGLVSLSEVMKHRLTEECLPLSNVNGTFRKTQKSKLLQNLTQQLLEVPSYTSLVDMGMIWRFASPQWRTGRRVMCILTRGETTQTKSPL